MTWVHYDSEKGWPSRELSLSGKPAHYLGRVLRSRVGDEVTIFDGRGKTARATIVELSSSRSATVQLHDVREHPQPESVLVAQIATVKGERLDYSLQKLTELGVDEIHLLTTERTVVSWTPERARSRLERCRDIIIAAAAQSQRAWLPSIKGPTALLDVVLPPSFRGLAMTVGHPDAEHLGEMMLDFGAPAHLAYAIGPEGGFTEAEIAALVAKGYGLATLGTRPLRAETAALSAAVLLGHSLSR